MALIRVTREQLVTITDYVDIATDFERSTTTEYAVRSAVEAQEKAGIRLPWQRLSEEPRAYPGPSYDALTEQGLSHAEDIKVA
jgi:hypothetical protein